MTCKEKRKAKQDERDIKTAQEILSGQVKIHYERPPKPAQANRKGGCNNTEEENEYMVEQFVRLLSFILPAILELLSAIEDPRSPKKIKHSFATLMVYGIVIFLSHMSSRRAANRELAGDISFEHLREYIPQLETMPHADTLNRLLIAIDPEGIEKSYGEIILQFIRSGTFLKLNPSRALVVIDGTQKLSRNYCWDTNALGRNEGIPDKERYRAYTLESVLVLEDGTTMPLLTEILENEIYGKLDSKQKQDCEQKAFMRLTEKLMKLLGKGCVTVVLDGLYATGPVISRCEAYGWDYMIALKNGNLKTVWRDYEGLRKIEPENILEVQWGDRSQIYQWSNSLEYIYGNNHKKLSLNLVVCNESWLEMHPRSGGKPELKKSKYAWLSSEKLTPENVFKRCTKIARYRWRIENNFLIEKHQGYNYSHCYSYDWNAMKGYHYLMKIGHFLNVLITHSSLIKEYVTCLGIRGFIKKVWILLTGGIHNSRANSLIKVPKAKISFCMFKLIPG